MNDGERTYLAIDLKSFYASAECTERGLDPLTTNLVVADPGRTEKTICLAVSPALKAYGIPGRLRLFEVIERVAEVNAARRSRAPGHRLTGESFSASELESHPELAVSYVTAMPRMSLYIEYSARIYNIYLKYIAPEDIHVYSIDEVFIDVTAYLAAYRMSARELAMTMIRDVLAETGITATAGIGSNLYLCKIAMDIVAKHARPDSDGVRIAELDEKLYRKELWDHRPLTDFWRVGRGYARKLGKYGMNTMGDVARMSLRDEELLYRLFGVNAEFLIDHAWGWEPCTIGQIKAYRPASNSFSSGQVMHCPCDFKTARLIVYEMADTIALNLVEKRMLTDQLTLYIGYDAQNLTDPEKRRKYKGEVTTDRFGRSVPKHAHGTASLGKHTSSSRLITEAVTGIFDRVADPDLLVRRVTVTTNHVLREEEAAASASEQLDLFTDYDALEKKRREEESALARERKMQEAILSIQKKYGRNSLLRGANLQDGSTMRERNRQIGGHKA